MIVHCLCSTIILCRALVGCRALAILLVLSQVLGLLALLMDCPKAHPANLLLHAHFRLRACYIVGYNGLPPEAMLGISCDGMLYTVMPVAADLATRIHSVRMHKMCVHRVLCFG